MTTIFQRTNVLADIPFHYCPGCDHGIIHRLVAEAIEELGIRTTIFSLIRATVT